MIGLEHADKRAAFAQFIAIIFGSALAAFGLVMVGFFLGIGIWAARP